MEIKKIVILFTLIANIGLLQAQYTAIPDSCFEQHLIDLGIDTEDTLDGQVLTADIVNVTSLTMNGYDYINDIPYSCYIDNLQGIEAFTSLETLDISTNGIQYLDVSSLLNLKKIYCDDNFMQTLTLPPSIEIVYARYNRFSQNIDFSQAINLTEIHLDAFWNSNESHITEINVSNSPNLIELTASFNDIINIDTSNNSLLEVLSIGENQNVSLINFTHNNPNLKTLVLVGSLTSLDISEMVNLEHFICVGNSIPNIDLTNNIQLNRIRIRNDDALMKIDIRNNNNNLITNFQALYNPNLNCIYVDNSQSSQENWLEVDATSTFVETEAECEALATDNINLENNIFVYPNPVKSILNIKTNNNEINKIVIYDFSGKVILETIKNKIDFSNNQKGIYFVKIITKDEKIINKKIIKIGT